LIFKKKLLTEGSRLQRTRTFYFIRLLTGLKMLQVKMALCTTNPTTLHLLGISS
jgi:hypothetical protein